MGTGERVSETVWEGLTKRVGLAGRSKPVSRTELLVVLRVGR